MTWILAIALISVLVYWWLKRIVKKAVVQPIRGIEVLHPILSEKTRIKVFWEAHGPKVGFAIGLILAILIDLYVI